MNILTFDIEEWFHVFEDHNNADVANWLTFEKRLPYMIDVLLDLLSKYNTKATFFCMGWIVERYPEIIKKIDSKGYEIGSHSNLHKLAHTQTRFQYSEDLKTSINTIEDLIGKKVKSYRAPGFSINSSNIWAFEELIKNGIEYDASVFPVERKFGGFSNLPSNEPFLISSDFGSLKEFPMNAHNVLGKNLVFSGGGFFRILPTRVIKRLIEESNYVMTYLHPRDFDNKQPFKTLSLSRHLKSRIGTAGATDKLEFLIKNFEFVDINQASKLIKWENKKSISLDSI
ncbi:polysaccharide deacetylase family protein [uncultured Polaribacter sp.]|uniref:polysaccharide deacetylase family protein n=1 Tax=uncultured Polaribacter sp. TaxID=174711 RepID=UPI00262926AB|nr:polysaccharide deacetylase family protein [uncultured Polaribacter sp.]